MMVRNRFVVLTWAILWLLTGVLAWPATSLAGPVQIPSQDGKLQIPAYWFESGDTGPRPVVIGLHGCGGALDGQGNFSDRFFRYAGYFNAEHMHFLVLDSFTPRGQKSICEILTSRRTINEEERREDVFAAIEWLSKQASVDASRIVVLGWSHGGQTVLSVLDAGDKFVQAQKIKPAAGVAFYPGCAKFTRMWNYEIRSPLLLMVGEIDDWAPASYCVTLSGQLKKNSANASSDLVVYPGSHHGFDSTGPVTVRDNVANTKSGKATIGGNPEAREASHMRLFDFLSAQLGQPLAMSHAQRIKGHHYRVPPGSGFAAIDDLAAVPVTGSGRDRYAHFRKLPSPKAFAVTENGRWYFNAGNPESIRVVFNMCAKARTVCWLYAVDDQVVWQPDVAARASEASLKRVGAPAR
ncbi:MAG: prolyl oligopeptidase family serine peptidase [Polaromonas sp.]|uniref:dienelactone hydrolase family protein n=1 Tax=Polaromonas sp. TaxID=1869339 RepID=UPI00326620FD